MQAHAALPPLTRRPKSSHSLAVLLTSLPDLTSLDRVLLDDLLQHLKRSGPPRPVAGTFGRVARVQVHPLDLHPWTGGRTPLHAAVYLGACPALIDQLVYHGA